MARHGTLHSGLGRFVAPMVVALAVLAVWPVPAFCGDALTLHITEVGASKKDGPPSYDDKLTAVADIIEGAHLDYNVYAFAGSTEKPLVTGKPTTYALTASRTTTAKLTSTTEKPGYASLDVSVRDQGNKDLLRTAVLLKPAGTFTLHIPGGQGTGTILILQLRGKLPAAKPPAAE